MVHPFTQFSLSPQDEWSYQPIEGRAGELHSLIGKIFPLMKAGGVNSVSYSSHDRMNDALVQKVSNHCMNGDPVALISNRHGNSTITSTVRGIQF